MAATLSAINAELQGVYGLTQQGSGPIPSQVVKTIEDALTHYQTYMAQLTPLLR